MISIRDAQFSYGRHKVFDNVSLQLEQGKIYGLLGENGVGKSTLFKILSGLLKLKSGECTLFGEVPYKRNPSFLREIYYIPEDFAGENIEVGRYAMQIGKFYPNFSPDRLQYILSEFGVDPNAKFTKLSHGQQKKAIIALALSLRTKVLLMDEPEISLHIEWQQRLITLVRTLNPNTQIILCTHSPAIIMDGWVDAVTEIEDITR